MILGDTVVPHLGALERMLVPARFWDRLIQSRSLWELVVP